MGIFAGVKMTAIYFSQKAKSKKKKNRPPNPTWSHFNKLNLCIHTSNILFKANI